MMKKLLYKINATFVLGPHLSPISGLTSQSKQQENCIHIDVLSSPQVNAFCCQKCSGLVGNWGYISRGLLRSFLWWPQLCYRGCKRRQWLPVSCVPFGTLLEVSCVTHGNSRRWHQWAQWFWSLPINFIGNGNFFPTSALQGSVWTQAG